MVSRAPRRPVLTPLDLVLPLTYVAPSHAVGFGTRLALLLLSDDGSQEERGHAESHEERSQ